MLLCQDKEYTPFMYNTKKRRIETVPDSFYNNPEIKYNTLDYEVELGSVAEDMGLNLLIYDNVSEVVYLA